MGSLKRPFTVSVLGGVFLGIFLNSSWGQPPPKKPLPLKPLKPRLKPLIPPRAHIKKVPEKTVVAPETAAMAPAAIPDLVISGFKKVESENPWMLERGFVAPGDRVVFQIGLINKGNVTYKGPVYTYATGLPEGWQMEGSHEEIGLSPYNTEAYQHIVKVSVTVPNNAVPGGYKLALRLDPIPEEKVMVNNNCPVTLEVFSGKSCKFWAKFSCSS